MIVLERRTITEVRSSAERWKQLDNLLQSLQRLAQVNAIIDVQRKVPKASIHAIMFEEGTDDMEKAIDRELSLLTVELLATELIQKKQKGK